MFPGKYDKSDDEARKKEFKRQQDRLKMMAPDSERKAVTADAMIDSLLQKSDTFKRTNNDIPLWARVDSPSCCPYYEKIWEMVRSPANLVDTAKISQLLLTSGLHPDILGFLWNLANKTTPGQLTKQELYIVLALVGLAQSGCTFNNVNVLNLVPSPPIPRLHFPNQPVFVPAPAIQSPSSSQFVDRTIAAPPAKQEAATVPDDDFTDFQFASSTSELTKSAQKEPLDTGTAFSTFQKSTSLPPSSSTSTSTVQIFDSLTSHSHLIATNPRPISFETLKETRISTEFTEKPKSEAMPKPTSLDLDADFLSENILDDIDQKKSESLSPESHGDEFAEFQSADAFDTSIVQPSKISLPKISSFIKVSPESEKKLRNLSQPESLVALPESKISSLNQVSSLPSIPVLGSSRSVGSRLANHTLGNKHQKHMKVKPIVSAATAAIPTEELFPKCLPKQSVFLLKETKIPSGEQDTEQDSEFTRRIEIPNVGTFKETTLPVHRDLLQEDKYGALRELEVGVEQNAVEVSGPDVAEDFGEFLSADLPSEKAVEAWTAWNSNVPESPMRTPKSESVTSTPPTVTPSYPTLENSSIDLMGDSFDLAVKDQEFGDFITPTADNLDSLELASPSLVRPQSVARRCLQCCQLLLKEALEIFNAVEDKAVLMEVFQTEQAVSYLKYLNIVYYISKRISMNSIGTETLYGEICDLWRQFHRLTQDYPVSLSDVEPIPEPGSQLNPCGVCKSLTSEEDIEKDGVRYHVSCANLWINCIEPSLPCF